MDNDEVIIRFATYNDVDNIMKTMRIHWDANHIVANNKEYFFYILGSDNNQINMVIGEEQSTGEIVGYLGFIKYNSSDYPDISLVLWKAVECKGVSAFLGVKLLFFLIENVKYALISSVGINPKTSLPILKSLKYHVGRLEHFYSISNSGEHKIAKITDKHIIPVTDYGWNILQIPNFETFSTSVDNYLFNEIHPHKDKCYFEKRFFAHPIYNYIVYAITAKDTDIISAILVCREIEKFGAKVLRIIDYVGKELYFSYLGLPFKKVMDENEYEYIDCYCFGMSKKTMNDAGFILRQEDDLNIIPNYFEPFLLQNVDIYYFSDRDNFRAFKGDSDQDQPRISDRTIC
jgi:hypothetical protein